MKRSVLALSFPIPSLLLGAALLVPARLPAVPSHYPRSSTWIASVLVPVDTGDTFTAQLATITTDTGAFAPGHHDFSHYNTPGLCRAAAVGALEGFQNSLAAQRIGDSLWSFGMGKGDTIGVGATAPIARACGAHFTLANTLPREHADLFLLALDEQNDALAYAVLSALLTQVSTPQARDDTLSFAMEAMLGRGRLTMAESLATLVDAQQPPIDRAARLELHYRLERYLEGEQQEDIQSDTSRFRYELEQVIALSIQERDYIPVLRSYQFLMSPLILEGARPDPPRALRLAQRAQNDLQRFTQADQERVHERYIGWGKLSLQGVIDTLIPLDTVYKRFVHDTGSMLAPRLHAQYWFPPPNHAASDTLRPLFGHVNLLIYGGTPGEDDFEGNNLQFGGTQGRRFRRWLAMYDTAGLAITIVRAAPDRDRDLGYAPLALRARGGGGSSSNASAQLFQSLQTEAGLWRWYYQEYERLPVTVAFQVRQEQWLPPPDGRRFAESGIQFLQLLRPGSHYEQMSSDSDAPHPGWCAIVGPDGRLLYRSTDAQPDGCDSKTLEILFRWLFAARNVMTATPTSHTHDSR